MKNIEKLKNLSIKLISISGGKYQSICDLLFVNKIFWNISLKLKGGKPNCLYIETTIIDIELKKKFNDSNKVQLILDIISCLSEETDSTNDTKFQLNYSIFRPIVFLHKIFRSIITESTLQYYVKVWIREKYSISLSSDFIKYLSIITNEVNSRISQESVNNSNVIPLSFFNQINLNLEDKLESNVKGCFIEICRNVGYIVPAITKEDLLKVKTNSFDIEYLVSFLFGFPTNIKGFDFLFGGWGLILPEKKATKNNNVLHKNTLGSKTISIMGECGSGKTLLGIQLAIDVASKGGVAWVVILEQTIEEYLYVIQSICTYSNKEQFNIATNYAEMHKAFKQVNINKGCLVIQKPPSESSLEEFLDNLADIGEDVRYSDLQLLIVDPINSLRPHNSELIELRKSTVDTIKRLKGIYTNILLIAEGVSQANNSHSNSYLSFVENISDSLIELSIRKEYNYGQRNIEIKKSRFQREIRGIHSFSIKSNEGIQIYPSSAAISSIIQSRKYLPPQKSIKFGFTPLDEILSKDAIFEGDVVVFNGPSGSFKSFLGYFFLLNCTTKHEKNFKPLSIIFDTLNSKNAIISQLGSPFIKDYLSSQDDSDEIYTLKTQDIRIISLPHGHINPGRILQIVDKEIRKARIEGYWIHKVLFNSIRQWQITSPYLSEDSLFGDTLIRMLRGFHTTSLLIFGNENEEELSSSLLYNAISENSDCLVKFDRIEFKGLRRVTLKVLKSRRMNHRLETFEIKNTGESINIEPTTLLLRQKNNAQGLHPVKIRMFFHFDSEIQRKYYDSISRTFKAVLSEDTVLDYQDRLYLNKTFQIGQLSSIDELQITQLDEFQYSMHISGVNEKYQPLYKFKTNLLTDDFWKDFLPELLSIRDLRRKNTGKDTYFYSIPFLHNISILAFRTDCKELNSEILNDWELLAKACYTWESDKNNINIKDTSELFFGFPCNSAENINSLYLEILFSFLKDKQIEGCPVKYILSSSEGIKSGRIFRQLAKRYIELNKKSINEIINPSTKVKKKTLDYCNYKAKVWRHWYTTFNQMISTFEENNDTDSLENFSIRAIPGGKSVSGEWYLAIPSYSAAPEAGLEIMKILTSYESELNRIRIGVGLPTRESFYKKNHSEKISFASNYSLEKTEVRKIISSSFRRSTFSCYSIISKILAYHLKMISEIKDPNEIDTKNNYEGVNKFIEEKIRDVFNELLDRIDFNLKGEFHTSPNQCVDEKRCKSCIYKFNNFINQ